MAENTLISLFDLEEELKAIDQKLNKLFSEAAERGETVEWVIRVNDRVAAAIIASGAIPDAAAAWARLAEDG